MENECIVVELTLVIRKNNTDLGLLIWIAFWIFSRDPISRQRLIDSGIPNPTNAEIGKATNVVLLAWLGASFLSLFVGCKLYFRMFWSTVRLYPSAELLQGLIHITNNVCLPIDFCRFHRRAGSNYHPLRGSSIARSDDLPSIEIIACPDGCFYCSTPEQTH